MGRHTLRDEHRRFIVEALACFDTPSQVVDAVKDEFGIKVTRQSVEAYDPTKRAGANIAEKWKKHFEATREAFKTDCESIPIANKAVRLRALQRMAQKAESMKNMVLAAQLYEQAAKEVGEAYTNRRAHEVSGPGGRPIPISKEMTPREAAEAYAASLHGNG